MGQDQSMEKWAQEFVLRYQAVRKELGRVIVGHDLTLDGILTCLFVGGHCLLEGVPGLGKTLLVRTLAETLDLEFSRIQFTPDLMPADILGTNMIVESDVGREMSFVSVKVGVDNLLAYGEDLFTCMKQHFLLRECLLIFPSFSYKSQLTRYRNFCIFRSRFTTQYNAHIKRLSSLSMGWKINFFNCYITS